MSSCFHPFCNPSVIGGDGHVGATRGPSCDSVAWGFPPRGIMGKMPMSPQKSQPRCVQVTLALPPVTEALHVFQECAVSLHPADQKWPPCLTGCHFLDVFDGFGDAFSQEAVGGFGDEDVVFDSDATEVTIVIHGVVVDERLEFPVGFPAVN